MLHLIRNQKYIICNEFRIERKQTKPIYENTITKKGKTFISFRF